MPEGTGRSLYCPACGANQATEKIVEEGREVTRCGVCSLVLEVSDARPYRALGAVLMADDQDLVCMAVEDMLLEKKLATKVSTSANGQLFIQEFVKRTKAGERIDLAILDVQMPVLDGFTAAGSLRAMERGLGIARPTPIIFFSGHAFNEDAKKRIAQLGRAIYVNKAASPNAADLAARLEAVLVNLLTKHVPG